MVKICLLVPLIIVSERSGISASAGPQTVALAGSRPRYTWRQRWDFCVVLKETFWHQELVLEVVYFSYSYRCVR